MSYDEPLFYRVMEYAAGADRDVVGMVSGTPDWEPPEGLRDGLRAYAGGDAEAFGYPPSEGLAALRDGVAERRGVDAERVVVTNGAAEANYLALSAALDGRGEEVVVADPTYPYYPGKVEMLGGTVRRVPVAAGGALDPAAVREVAGPETACVLVNTPNNPTGAVYGEKRMRELAAAAADHGALFVSDETYERFDRSGAFHSALNVDPPAVVTGSFSKSLAIPGFRVGYAVLPPALVDDARTRHMLVNVAGSRPAQRAVLAALRTTGPGYYRAARERLAERVDRFTAALDRVGADYTEPDGGFYVMARFPGYPGTMANVERLIEEAGVAGMPGETFGASRREWIRFALVTPRVETAAKRLRERFG